MRGVVFLFLILKFNIMAAGNFTASDYPNVLARMAAMEAEDLMANASQVETLQLVTSRQSVDIEPLLTNTGQCRSVDAWFLANGTQRHLYSGSAADVAQGCDLKAAQELETIKKTFTNNYVVTSGFVADSKKCNNASMWVEETAKGLRDCMADNRRQLKNKHLYPLLNANVQTNEANSNTLTDFVADGVTGHLKLDPTKWNFESALKMDLLANQNHFGERAILSGSNLYFDSKIAEYRKLNMGIAGQDQAAIFGDVLMAWDTRDMDAVLTEQESFIVDLSKMITWNSSWYSDTPELRDASKNRYTYRIPDPVLTWNNNGTQVPFYHHVEVEYTCTSRDSMNEPVYSWTYNVTLIGGMDIAPAQYNYPVDPTVAPTRTRTGILGIRNKA